MSRPATLTIEPATIYSRCFANCIAEKDLTSVIVTHNERIAVQCDEVWELDAGVLKRIQGIGHKSSVAGRSASFGNRGFYGPVPESALNLEIVRLIRYV